MSNTPQPRHPAATGLGDGVQYGFRAVESVAEGLRESLLLRVNRPAAAPRTARAAAARTAARTTRGRAAAGTGSPVSSGAGVSGALTGELLRLFVDALEVAGGIAQDVADALTDSDHGEDDQHVTLEEVEVVQEADGKFTTDTFTIWNTGHAALTNVTFTCTDVIGPSPIKAGKVTFDPPDIPCIESGNGMDVKVTVTLPAGTRITGENRGVIVADPGGTVLLTVRARR